MDIANIAKVYSGRCGCACGCLGKYSYNEGVEHEEWQGKTSVRSVKIIAGKVLNNPNVKWIDGTIAYVEDRERNRSQAVYFKEAV